MVVVGVQSGSGGEGNLDVIVEVIVKAGLET